MARGYRFSPAEKDGAPVESRYSLRLPFRLEYDRARPTDDPLTPWPELDLPTWSDAPNHARVEAMRPPRLAAGVPARGVLGCRAREDLSLDCEVVRETPAGIGVGAASLAVSRLLRIASRDARFAVDYRRKRFSVPILFGHPPGWQPVGGYDGAPIQMPEPPREFVDAIYPAAARNAGIEGAVELACVLATSGPGRCAVTSERPAGRGFGDAALQWTRSSEPESWEMMTRGFGMLEGDELRWRIPFTLAR